jgi:hypothetical protein
MVVGATVVVTLPEEDVPVPVEKVPNCPMGAPVSTPKKAERIAVAVTAEVRDPAAVSTVTVSVPAVGSMA